MTITWADPPPLAPNGAASMTAHYDAIVDELRSRPGKWALVAEYQFTDRCRQFQNRGCDTRYRTVRRDGLKGIDTYACWPDRTYSQLSDGAS